MGNGQVAEKRAKECYLCGSDISKASYFLGLKTEKVFLLNFVKVCPECHHFFVYGSEDQLENYKKRRNIIL